MRYSNRSKRPVLNALFGSLFWLVIAGCAVEPVVLSPASDQEAPTPGLRAGDIVRVTVYKQPELSGEFTLDDDGNVWLPVIGGLEARGLTNAQLQAEIFSKLSPTFLKSPMVTVEVLGHRPIYILGEVNKPGSYPYSTDISVAKAIAMAGGFTYRAATRRIEITRKTNDGRDLKLASTLDSRVLSGDLITVSERLF